ncbi:MAG: indolepyruvate oxidoreductase subunit beta [Desulfurococcaceae archaeon]|nr:indolepyruvate oxidoreductase subunit beta [Desulfurococcaceae archaeon]
MGRRVVNVAIASVGGQGGLTLSRVLAVAAVYDGFSVRTGETLGMAQRFGSVVSYVRFGDSVLSPTFSEGEADYLIGLELVEALRALRLLKPGGLALVASVVKPPLSASLRREELPAEALLEEISRYARTVRVPAVELALRVGNPRAVNMVMLGVFAATSGTPSDSSIRRAIAEVVPARWVESSVRAYELGRSFVLSGS